MEKLRTYELVRDEWIKRNACDDGRVYVHPIQSTAILDNKKRTSIFSPSSNPTKLSNTARTHIPKTPLHYSLTYLFLLRPCDSSRITAGSRAGAGAVSGAANGDDDGGSGGGGGARTGDGGDGDPFVIFFPLRRSCWWTETK